MSDKEISIMTGGHSDTPVTKEYRCKNCIYCKVGVLFEKSTCRALPPFHMGDAWDGYRRWPEVNKDEDWCGMFKPRK